MKYINILKIIYKIGDIPQFLFIHKKWYNINVLFICGMSSITYNNTKEMFINEEK